MSRIVTGLVILLTASAAFGDDSVIFDSSVTDNPYGIPESGVAGKILATGYKKIPADEGLNQWSFDLEAGPVISHPSVTGETGFRNLYLAFAVDVRYARDCYGTKQSSLCTFLHSAVRLSSNMGWNDGQSTDRYEVVAIPVEYVTGSFGKEGPDLKSTGGALFASVGARAEYLRDLGLDIEHRMLGAISGAVNYSSAQQGLTQTLAFRWIGSMRAFVGGAAVDVAGAPTGGAVALGLETVFGIALDLQRGSVAFTNGTQFEADIGVGAGSTNLTTVTDKIELKYLYAVCRTEGKGGCKVPRAFAVGGGVRYEYGTSFLEAGNSDSGGPISGNQAIHRLIFFAELARF